ncbi:MAG: hypothetical protein ONB17_03105 [candidate division KSB1 bacterium]|nr:hypothetical protein [candidate division KSB1 bacterium]
MSRTRMAIGAFWCVAFVFAHTAGAQSPRLGPPILYHAPGMADNDLALGGAWWRVESIPQSEESASPRAKSGALAAVASGVVPGAGQLYAGSYWKALGFLVAEVTSWTLYAHWDKEGDRIKTQFRQFADTHWREEEYWAWIALESGRPLTDMAALREWEREHFSHFLHEQKDQQYYEMIGKYDQFNIGWDDTNTPRGRDSARRDYYETLRDNSNKAYKKAAACQMVALANHGLSALDAAWTVSRHNRRTVRTSLRIVPVPATGDYALNLQVAW